MRLIGLAVILTLSFVLAPLAAGAQPPRTIPRLAVLFPAEAATANYSLAPFQQALRDLGYVEGQTVTVEYRYGHGKTEHFPVLMAELVRLKPDVMVVGSGVAAQAAKGATQTIPVIFVGAGDPVGNKLVTSFARPGGNVTGLSLAFEDGFAGKWVELLAEAVPRIRRVGFLHDPANLTQYSNVMQIAARRLGLTLRPSEVHEPDQLENAFAALVTDRAEGLIVGPSVLFHAHHRRIVALAAKHQRPAIYGFRIFVDAGGLMSYGVSIPDLWRRSATYVDKILKGAKPANLPVEQPTKFELVINLKTAKTLGLTIPQSILVRADEIIQ